MQDNGPTWKALLEFAVEQGVDALLDCGALLAGGSNRSAIIHMLASSPISNTSLQCNTLSSFNHCQED
jgi:hypothetical protein